VICDASGWCREVTELGCYPCAEPGDPPPPRDPPPYEM
jgi:hypothetical protein